MSYQNLCGAIGAGVALDCANIPVGGTSDRMIVFNLSDLDAAGTTYGANGEITSLALKSGSQAYQIDGLNQTIAPSVEMVRQGSVPRYNHSAQFRAFKVDQVTKEQLEKMASGRMGAVLESLGGKYEVYGLEVGLRAEEMTRNPNDQETNGLFVITLRTPENVPAEPRLPREYLNTDYATTTAELESLLSVQA
jgi:hypothetical protein